MKKWVRSICFVVLFCTAAFPSFSQTKLIATLSKNIFNPGDTLNFEINLSDSFKNLKTASLHLWIEEITTGKKWHYKYPLINGYLNARLQIDSSLKSGPYALTFLLQKNFFRIKGEVKNAFRKENQINYVLLSKNKEIVPGNLPLDNDKFFVSECMLFQDSAYIVFTRREHKGIIPEIKLINDLDSSYTIADSITDFINLYDPLKDTIPVKIEKPAHYSFSEKDRLYKTLMPEVVVNAKTKKLIDDYQKDNVSGMFGGVDGTVIDGLESDEIARSGNLFNFLTGRIAGLTIKPNDEGIDELFWRKHHTDIYIDEVKVDPEMALNISTADIAMIKIFEPGVQVSFGSGAGGTVAIYLKNGIYKKDDMPTNNFRIMGYTGLDVLWK